jgi:Skp family chaperone for outer membrane proteins
MGALGKVPWRLVAAIGAVAVVAFAGWRVNAWHESHVRLKATQAELKAERACEPATACQRRAEAWAAQAKLDAEKAAQAALGKAQEAEAKAKADAAAWRAKYRAALTTDPGCKAWSESPVACPL